MGFFPVLWKSSENESNSSQQQEQQQDAQQRPEQQQSTSQQQPNVSKMFCSEYFAYCYLAGNLNFLNCDFVEETLRRKIVTKTRKTVNHQMCKKKKKKKEREKEPITPPATPTNEQVKSGIISYCDYVVTS